MANFCNDIRLFFIKSLHDIKREKLGEVTAFVCFFLMWTGGFALYICRGKIHLNLDEASPLQKAAIFTIPPFILTFGCSVIRWITDRLAFKQNVNSFLKYYDPEDKRNASIGVLITRTLYLTGVYFIVFLIIWKFIAQDYNEGSHVITTSTGQRYVANNFEPEVKPYTDLSYTMDSKALPGCWNINSIITTASDDKFTTGDDLFQVKIHSLDTVEMYILHDIRAERGDWGQVPKWLTVSSLLDISLACDTPKGLYGDKLCVYKWKVVPSKEGTILTFGGNLVNRSGLDSCNMYSILSTANWEAFERYNPLTDMSADSLDFQPTTVSFLPKMEQRQNSNCWDVDTIESRLNTNSDWLSNKECKDSFRLDLSPANYRGHMKSRISGIHFSYANFSSGNLIGNTIDKSQFSYCRFYTTQFSSVSVKSTDFFNCIFNNANFSKAKFLNTRFVGCDFQGADFSHTQFNRQTDFSYCTMDSVIFEPDSLPNIQGMALAENLDQITYNSNPSALIRLRQELKKAGFDKEQRKITAAIRRRQDALNPNPIIGKATYLLFDLPSSYGTDALRPVISALLVTYIATNIYLIFFFVGWLKMNAQR